jgi:signal transduction histidine kinase
VSQYERKRKIMESAKPKILIVDDKPENLFALAKLLGKLDVSVIKADSGPEALALTLDHEFSMAIVDVQMPDMDGYELVELLRGNRSTARLPIIFVSAIYADEYHHRKGYDAGAVDFISKPFIPEILLSKVRVFLELYEQRREIEGLYKQVVGFNEELEAMVKSRTAELEAAYQTLALLDQNKSDFINVIAHELRTPLSLVKGYGEMLRGEPRLSDSEDLAAMLDGVVTGAGRMQTIIGAMLDLARIENNVLETIFEPCSLESVINGVRDELADVLTRRRLTLRVELNGLPAVAGDTELLAKLFGHLLRNAVKVTPDGGEIEVNGRLTNSEAVEISVRDNGIGIDPQFHELIFTKFYQTGPVALHSSGQVKFKGGGPGLGLTIAQGIAQLHGGKIWVESAGCDEQACPGSVFYVRLPVEQAVKLAAEPV